MRVIKVRVSDSKFVFRDEDLPGEYHWAIETDGGSLRLYEEQYDERFVIPDQKLRRVWAPGNWDEVEIEYA